MGLLLRFWVEKTVHCVETYRLSNKEKGFDAEISKKTGLLTIFWHIKGIISINFLEKDVNSASFW